MEQTRPCSYCGEILPLTTLECPTCGEHLSPYVPPTPKPAETVAPAPEVPAVPTPEPAISAEPAPVPQQPVPTPTAEVAPRMPPTPRFDPNTGQPLVPRFDPNTGQPLVPRFDPNTGQPLQQRFDPLTGKPLQPRFDPKTGQPLTQQPAAQPAYFPPTAPMESNEDGKDIYDEEYGWFEHFVGNTFFRSAFDFSLTTSRKSFWVCLLWIWLLSGAFWCLELLMPRLHCSTIFQLICAIPMLSMTMRRIRDANGLVWAPLITILLYIFACFCPTGEFLPLRLLLLLLAGIFWFIGFIFCCSPGDEMCPPTHCKPIDIIMLLACIFLIFIGFMRWYILVGQGINRFFEYFPSGSPF